MSNEQGSMKSTKKISAQRYIAFSLANKQFAIPIQSAKEFVGMTEPTPVPHGSDFYKGIINLRGKNISIIDLRAKLNLLTKEVFEGTKKNEFIIVLNNESLSLGLIVDSINNVIALSNEDLVSLPPDTISEQEFIVGVTKKHNRLTHVIDPDSLLSLQERDLIGNPWQVA